MKIDFKIDTQELGELDHYLVIDYLEILLLAKEYDEISKGDLDDILRDQGVYDRNALPHLEWFRRDPRFATSTDIQELYCDIVWECLTKRVSMLGTNTPFELDQNVLRMNSTRLANCSDYCLLLLCSKLRMVDRAKRQEFADMFEDVCLNHLKNKLFTGADVKRFSKGGSFSTKLREAIVQLADWLKEPVRQSTIDELSDHGDLGLDLVGSFNTDPYAQGSAFFVAQCAAREIGWQKKKSEATMILGAIDSLSRPLTLIFIPHVFRSGDGNWARQFDARDVTIFDRVRLLAP